MAPRVDPNVFAAIAPDEDPYAPSPIEDIPEGIADRFRHFTKMGHSYAQEYVDKTLHYLLLRGASGHEIAREFRVHVTTVYTWKKRLRERFTREAEATDFRPIFHETMVFFDDARAMALQQYALATTTKDRIACINAAVRSQLGLHRFLSLSGFFDTRALPDRSGDDPHAARAANVVNLVQDAFGVFDVDADDEVLENEPASD